MSKPILNRIPVSDDKFRTCKICNESKQLNLDFNYKAFYDCYSNSCKDCNNKRRRLQYKREIDTTDYSVLKNGHTRKKRVIEGKPWRKTIFPNKKRLQYKSTDKKRGWVSDLTVDYMKIALDSPCHYCGFPSNGLDRIDNSIGHIMTNCVPCCYTCNIVRNDVFSYEEMMILGKTIREIKLKRQENGKDN